jgi:hypothetical protein
MRIHSRLGAGRAAASERGWRLLRFRRRFWPAVAALVIAVAGLYSWLIRPYHLRWGATDQEVAMALPGDGSIPPTAGVSTRAITIHAPAATVWAWLVQTGQNRGGGWHSYDWLENLFAADMQQVERIEPRWQQLQVGDTLFYAAGGATNAAMVATVTMVEPGRTLVLGQGWTFALHPIDSSTTRLIVRYPLRPDEFGNPAFTYAIFEPAHFVMESGMLLGIKRRAERDPWLQHMGAR